ncbi:hypothetical protein Tco_0889467 [Tanacetum coccineum]
MEELISREGCLGLVDIRLKEEVVPQVYDVSLVDEVFDGAFGGEGEDDVVMGEGVMVTSSSLEMLTNSCLGVDEEVSMRDRKGDSKIGLANTDDVLGLEGNVGHAQENQENSKTSIDYFCGPYSMVAIPDIFGSSLIFYEGSFFGEMKFSSLSCYQISQTSYPKFLLDKET